MEFRKRRFPTTILPAAGPILVCVVLILLQPDLVLRSTSSGRSRGALCPGLSWKWLAAGGVAALPILYLLIAHVSYRKARLMAFLDPGSDPQGAGSVLQSLIAVARADLTGVGLMESKQKLFYLPIAHTDFIYGVIAKNWAFLAR